MRKNKKKLMQTVAWLCCASLVSGAVVPTNTLAAGLNANYEQALEKASAEPNIQTVTLEEEKELNNSHDTVVDLSEHVGMYTKNVTSMEWSVDFKTTDKNIQSIMAIGSAETNIDNYMTMYIMDTKIGFEFREGTNNFSKSITLPATVADGEYHNLKLVVKTGNQFELFYDGESVGTWSAGMVFLNDVSYTPDFFTVGGMKRKDQAGNDGKNWYFNGTIKNIYAQTIAPSTEEPDVPVEANLVYEAERLTMNSGSESVSAAEAMDTLKELEQGTVTVRYRAKSATQGLSALFSLSSTQEGRENSYAVMYVNPGSSTIGVEIRDSENGTTTNYNQSSVTASVNNDYWHTVTYVFGKSSFTLYLDGEVVLQNNKTGFFDKISDPTAVKVGALDRVTGANQWGFAGYIDKVQVWDAVLGEEQILPEHEATKQKEVETETPEGVMKTEDIKLFYQGYDNSVSYRIPALITTMDGTVVAGIDKRQSGAADLGNIDAVIRRSLDGGKTWLDPQTLIDLPQGGNQYSFSIDASMVQDKETGRLFFIVDMFPESTALMAGDTINEVSSGYKEVDGERYYILIDSKGNEYTIREKGQVYDANGNLTDYTVPKMSNGILYKSGEECGNIFLRTGENAGELRALKTSYLWMVYSDDDGETWSEPTDITKGIKKDWQLFFGTGPGVGIQMENGRLVVPVYYTNSVIGDSQSSAVIYSDDHGKTWKCGESPNDGRNFNGQKLNTETMHNTNAMLTESQVVEVKDNDGKAVLKLFCRSLQGHVMIATSYDGGETWEDDLQQDAALRDPYCQMTVVPYPYEVKGLEGKQLFIFANPDAESRSNGTVRLGYYDPDTDQFVWPYSQVVYPGNYAYSCLSVIGEDNIGLFYEATVPDMMFTRFNPEWIINGSSQVVTQTGPEIKQIVRDGDTVVLEASEAIFLMGNMTLKAVINGTEQNLVYQSGSGTSKLVFALPENTPADAEIVYDAMDEIQLLDKYYGNAKNETFVAAGIDGLNKIIKEAEALSEVDYSSGWELLQEKLAAANEVKQKLNPTEDEIRTAEEELQAAMDALVVASVDKTALQTAIDTYKDVKAENYSQKSWKRLESAMNQAREVIQATSSTQSQVDEATEQLIAAGQALGVDKSALWAAIDKYDRYVQQKYEEAGWDVFAEALENAKEVVAMDSLTQVQIDAALNQLTDAAAALKALPEVDKIELRALMHQGGAYKEENYDADTWEGLKLALQEAKKVSADQTASQTVVNNAYEALKEAVSNLNIIAGNVGGVVTDENGNDIAGVTISIGDISTKTAADGTYLLYGVPLATSEIVADDDQYITVTEEVTVTKEDSGVNKVIQNFVLKEASAAVKGVVTAVGVPMPGLTVTISSGDVQETAVTDENGAYCFENLPTRDYVIQTEAEGYEAFSKKFSAVKQNDNIVNLMLLPKTQEGVFDYENSYEDGTIYWDNLAGTANITFENKDGASYIHFPGGGNANAYETKAPKFKNGCVEMDLTSVGQSGIRVGILLRAVDMNHRVFVGVGDAEDLYFTEYWGNNGNDWSDMTTAEAFEADKKMHLKAEIIDKTITLWVNGTQVLSNTMDDMPMEAGAVGLNCRAAKDVIVDNIKVTSYDEPTGEVETVAGHVSNDGKAVIGAAVTLLQGEDVIARVTTDELGNYKFKNVPYGTYTVTAQSGGFSKSVDIVVEETDGYCVAPEIEFDQAEIVDKSELKVMVDAFDAYSKDDYTEESFAAFAEALEAAKAVLADENATQKNVEDAITALETTASELVKKPVTVDKSVLQAAVAIYDSYNEEDYVAESFAPFAEALEAAKAVLSDEAATQAQVDDALKALNDAAGNLEQIPVVDKSKLEAALSIYNQYDAADYTKESFEVFANALIKANEVLANEDATQQEVDLALEIITAAAKGLEKAKPPVVVNKSSLNAVVTILGQYQADDYTEESFARLQNALAQAREVLADETASQATVDAITMTLIEVVKQLEKPVKEANKAGLKAAVSIYGTYSANDYTEESFAALTESLEKAKAVIANEAATQKEVDDALNALNQAAAALEKDQTVQPLSISYTTHVQNLGWQAEVANGEMSGTKGRSLRLEGIKIRVNGDGLKGGIEYSTHVQNEGWQKYVSDGEMSGTKGKSLRLEGIKIRLTGELAEKYSVEYRTHVQNEGWQKWVKDDAMSGTKGKSLRLEGIEIRLIKK